MVVVFSGVFGSTEWRTWRASRDALPAAATDPGRILARESSQVLGTARGSTPPRNLAVYRSVRGSVNTVNCEDLGPSCEPDAGDNGRIADSHCSSRLFVV
jgi:hypothetical protein